MHKKMLSILLLVGSALLAVGEISLAAAKVEYTDVQGSAVATDGALWGDGTDTSAGVKGDGTASPAIVVTTEDVAIGSSVGSSPATDWVPADGLPANALKLVNIIVADGSAALETVSFGGILNGAALDSFTGGTGSSKNFALSVGNVFSDQGSSPATDFQPIAVTSGGTARWVGITSLTAQSATVKGSSTTDTAWSALDGNVLDIGTFTVATKANSGLTATATTGNALLRIDTIDYGPLTADEAFTLTAAGSATKTATIELTAPTATLGGVTAKTTIDLDAGGVLKANNLVLDGLASAAAEDKVAFTDTAGEIVTTGTFTVHTTALAAAAGTLANVTAGGKATFDQGQSGDAQAVVKLGSKFTSNGLDVIGSTSDADNLTTLTMATGGTEVLVGAVTAASGDTPASTTLADVNLKGGVIATAATNNNKITAAKVNALGSGNALTAATGTALAVDADVFSGTATEAGAIALTGAGGLTVKSITQGLNAGADGTTLAGDVTVTGLVSTLAMTGTNTATVEVADAAALLHVGNMTYASTTSNDKLTLTATGNASGKTATAGRQSSYKAKSAKAYGPLADFLEPHIGSPPGL